jgi:hypothetical protein
MKMIDTDSLAWSEEDIRMQLMAKAESPRFFPNAHVYALVGKVADWRAKLKDVAMNSTDELLKNRSACIIVGMMAEGPLPQPLNYGNDTAVCTGE